MSTRSLIAEILEKRCFAVCGVSDDPAEAGFKVFKILKNAGYTVYPVSESIDKVDGDLCYPTLDNIPEKIDCLVTVTTPEETEALLAVAGHLHVPYLWMQPGSESMSAYNKAQGYSMRIISGGPSIIASVAKRQEWDALPA